MNNVQEAAKNFEDMRKRCRMLYIIYGIGMLAALAMMFLQEMKSALLIFVLLLIIYFVIVRSAIRQYTAAWREYCARLFTEKHVAPAQYSYRVRIADIPEMQKHIMMPLSEKGKLTARCLIRGSNAGIHADFADATVTVGSGTSTRFYSGCWMGFSFESRVQDTFRAVVSEIMADDAYDRWLTETQNFSVCPYQADMPAGCRLYAMHGNAALPQEAVQPLRTLLKSITGAGVVDICPEGLYVFLPYRLINKLPPSLKVPVTEGMINSLSFPEIDHAWLLALTLRNVSDPGKEGTA